MKTELLTRIVPIHLVKRFLWFAFELRTTMTSRVRWSDLANEGIRHLVNHFEKLFPGISAIAAQETLKKWRCPGPQAKDKLFDHDSFHH